MLRRAKAKLQDGKKGGRNGIIDVPPDMPPELAAGFDMSLHTMIHESERMFLFTLVPVTVTYAYSPGQLLPSFHVPTYPLVLGNG